MRGARAEGARAEAEEGDEVNEGELLRGFEQRDSSALISLIQEEASFC